MTWPESHQGIQQLGLDPRASIPAQCSSQRHCSPWLGTYQNWANTRINTSGKESACQCRRLKRLKRHRFDPWVRKIPWRRAWQPSPVFLPGESHGQTEPSRLQSIRSQRVGHDEASWHAHMYHDKDWVGLGVWSPLVQRHPPECATLSRSPFPPYCCKRSPTLHLILYFCFLPGLSAKHQGLSVGFIYSCLLEVLLMYTFQFPKCWKIYWYTFFFFFPCSLLQSHSQNNSF